MVVRRHLVCPFRLSLRSARPSTVEPSAQIAARPNWASLAYVGRRVTVHADRASPASATRPALASSMACHSTAIPEHSRSSRPPDRGGRQVHRVEPSWPRRRQAAESTKRLLVERRDDRIAEVLPTAGGQHLERHPADRDLELDVEERLARDCREHGRERGHAGTFEFARREVRRRRRQALDPLQRGVVEHDRDAVPRQPDVELEAVAGRQVRRGKEGVDRILGVMAMVAPVRQAQRSRSRSADGHQPTSRCAASPRWSVG